MLPTVAVIVSVRRSLFMERPPIGKRYNGNGDRVRPPCPFSLVAHLAPTLRPFSLYDGPPCVVGRDCEIYRHPTDPPEFPAPLSGQGVLAGLGVGETPQIADAQGGSGGVGIRNSFPWVDAGTPVIQVPAKVLMFGYGV